MVSQKLQENIYVHKISLEKKKITFSNPYPVVSKYGLI